MMHLSGLYCSVTFVLSFANYTFVCVVFAICALNIALMDVAVYSIIALVLW